MNRHIRILTVERAVFWLLPAVVLLGAFVGVCVQAGTPWPWHRVVHEDGVRTLMETVFYFEHATREIVPDLVLAMAVAGAVRYFYPPQRATGSAQAARWRKRLGGLAAATLAAILGGTIWSDGGQAIIDNLSQLHTRAGAPLVWGAHWRYHLIERFAQILLAFATSGLIWMLHGRPDARPTAGRLRLFATALALFAALTLLFHPTTEPFRDPAFLGHQLRELFTHTLVTLPLALGVCFEMAQKFSPGEGSGSNEHVWPIWLAGSVSVLSGAFLLAASVLTAAQSHGQATGLAALLFPHFAEHSLGYVLVPTAAGWLYLWRAPA